MNLIYATRNAAKVMILCAIFFAGVAAVASNSGVTYQGRILKPDGSPLEGSNVQFRMQIRTPGSENCLLYEEQQNLDMRDTKGLFSLTLNDGTGARLDSSGLTIDRIFSNRGTLNFSGGACSVGSTYSADVADGRKLIVQFKDETMSSWEPMPATNINFVPFAFESKQVQGFSSSSLVRVQEADGTMGNISPLSNASYTELLSLIAGSSTQYVRNSTSAGARVPTYSGNPSSAVAGSIWFDTSSNQLKFRDGSGVQTVGTSAGGVTSVTAGSGLATTPAGGITSSGSIAIAVGGVVSTMIADGSVVTAKVADGAVTDVKLANGAVITAKLADNSVTSAKIVDATIATADLADGSVTSAKIFDGTIAGSDLASNIVISTTGGITASGFTTSGTVSANAVTAPTVSAGVNITRQIQLFDPDSGSTNKITFTADSTLSSDYTLTWPLDDGTANQVLITDGSGKLSWTTITPGSGDFKADGTVPMTGNLRLGSQWLSNDGDAEGIRVLNNGRVGIGTATPEELLDVAGAIRVGTTTTCGAPNPGTIRYSSGNLEYCNGTAWQVLGVAGAGITALTGDVTASGTGSVAATIANSAVTSAKIADGTVATADVADSAITSLKIADGTIATADVADKAVTFGKIQDIATNKLVGRSTASSGPLEEIAIGTGLSLSGGTLSSTATDSFAATSCANGELILRVAGAWACVGATSAGTADTVVRRDSSGNFVAGTATLTSSLILKDGAAGGGVTIATPVGFTSYALTLPSDDGNSGQVLSTNGSGQLSWATVTSGTGDFKADGSVPMTGNLRLGSQWLSNDGGNEGIRVDNSGNVGVGTATPGGLLTVEKSSNASTEMQISTPGVSTNQDVYLSLVTKSNNSWLGQAANKGWMLTARGDAFSNAAAQNDFIMSYWNGSSYISPLSIDSLTGNVGLGTASPQAVLDVAGAIRVGTMTTCGAPNPGTIRYNSGNLEYCNGTAWQILGVAGAGITALTGDVTASGTGSVASTIANDAITSAKIADGTLATADVADKAVTFAKIQDIATNKLVGRSTASSGPIEEIAIGTGLSLSGGTLSSTATDSFAAISCANGELILKVAGAWACVGATSAGTADAIVRRDSSGNFVAGSATLTSSLVLKDGAAGGGVTIATPVGFTNYSLTLPSDDGNNGQVLTTNGSGALSWSTPATGSGDFKADGTVPMTGNLQLNNNWLSNDGGAEGIRIDNSGNVGLGQATPSYRLHIGPGAGFASSTTKPGGASVVYSMMARTTAASSVSQIIGVNDGTRSPRAEFFVADHATEGLGGWGLWSSYGTGGSQPFVLGVGNVERMRVDINGKVGIGTSTPQEVLDVAGAIRVGTTTTCGAPNPGTIRYNSGNLEYCNGTAWQVLGVSGAGITALTGDVTASGSGSVTATIATGAVTNTKLGDNSVTSAKIVDGAVATADVADKAVTFAKLQDIATNKLVGRSTASSGPIEEITIGTGLSLSGGTLTASATGLPACADGQLAIYVTSAWTCVGVGSTNTASTVVRRDASGNFTAGSATLTTSLILKDGAAGGGVTIATPSGFTSYALTLPADDGTSNQVLTTNGSGVLSWSTPAGGGITALTGDVTASGTGSVATTIANSSVTSAKIADGTIATADVADSAITSLKIADGTVATADVADKAVTFAKVQDVATNKLVGRSTASSGPIEEISIGTGLSLSGGTLSSSVIGLPACADGQLALYVSTAWTCVGASAANTASAVVRRDASGNFVAGSATLTSSLVLKDGAAGGQVSIATPVGFTNYSLTLPADDGTSGQVLSTDGSGVLSWATAGGGLPSNSIPIYQVRAATTANITLSGTQTIDGVSVVAGNRVLVKNQSTAAQNGVYVVAAGAWTRAADMDAWSETNGYEARVSEGTTWAGMTYTSSTTTGGTLGTTAIQWNAAGSGNSSRLNTANGYQALSVNTGQRNTANGYSALLSNTTGGYNTADGAAALLFNTTGERNTAIGYGALWNNSAKSESTAVGYYSMNYAHSTTTASVTYNTALGAFSLEGSTTPTDNTGLRNTALGHSALRGMTSGSDNIGVGYNAGSAITTGSGNVVIGSNTGSTIATSSNNILIADGVGTERVRIDSSGNVGVGTSSPQARLDVSGAIRIGTTATCAAGSAGTIRYNSGSLEFCNGSAWQVLGTGGSGITAITGDVTASGTGSVAATIASKAVTFAKMQDIATNKLVGRSTAATGAMEEISIGTGLSLSGGTLSSSVTGLPACADGQLALYVSTAWTCVGATSANTASTIVRRDVSGNFVSSSATLTSSLILKDGASGGQVSIATPVGFTNYSLTLPIDDGTSGQVLTTNGSGVLSWSSAGAGSGDFKADGTVSMTGNIKLNNNWLSNDGGNEGIRVDNSGNVGIGTAAPTNKLHVVGDGNAVLMEPATPTGGVATYMLNSGNGTLYGIESSVGGWLVTGSSPYASVIGNQSARPFQIGTNNAVRVTVDSTGNTGIGTSSPGEKLEVTGNMKTTSGQIYAAQNTVSSGATIDFNTGNVQVVAAPGGSALTLNNMKDGGSYTVIVTDSTSRTYTFTNCTNPHFVPDNGPTISGSRTIYTILKTTEASATHCYISWITGF